jgi:catechol 2,3-dioxygenase
MRIGHLALRVADPEQSARHLTDVLGLRITERNDAEIRLSSNRRHHEIQLIASSDRGVDHLGLEVDSTEELERWRKRAGDAVVCEAPDETGVGPGFRCLSPDGFVVDVYAGMERAPFDPVRHLAPLARKFGHIFLQSSMKDEAEAFWIQRLGFRVSDRIGHRVWLRCDADHHGVALIEAQANALHHYAFEVPSIGELQAYLDRLIALGQTVVWGPGRHGPGMNIFTYKADPDGALLEVYCDALQIEDDATYVAQDWNNYPSWINLWGPSVPDGYRDFGIPFVGRVAKERKDK